MLSCDVVRCHVFGSEVTEDGQCGWLRDVMLSEILSFDVM